jgi:polysaccharide chain length determinant protein (PEP-CTERM system associated)
MSIPRHCLRPLLSGLAVQPNVEQQIKMMTRQLVSRPTLEKVARMTDLDVKAKTPEETEAMLNGLASKISIADAGRENLYTIAFQDPNGDLAKKVVQSLLTIFVEGSLGKTRQDISSSQRFIEEQLQQYKQKLDEAESALTEFKRKNIGMMPGEGGGYYAKLAETARNAAPGPARPAGGGQSPQPVEAPARGRGARTERRGSSGFHQSTRSTPASRRCKNSSTSCACSTPTCIRTSSRTCA